MYRFWLNLALNKSSIRYPVNNHGKVTCVGGQEAEGAHFTCMGLCGIDFMNTLDMVLFL